MALLYCLGKINNSISLANRNSAVGNKTPSEKEFLHEPQKYNCWSSKVSNFAYVPPVLLTLVLGFTWNTLERYWYILTSIHVRLHLFIHIYINPFIYTFVHPYIHIYTKSKMKGCLNQNMHTNIDKWNSIIWNVLWLPHQPYCPIFFFDWWWGLTYCKQTIGLFLVWIKDLIHFNFILHKTIVAIT